MDSARCAYPGNTCFERRRRIRFFIRSTLTLGTTTRWLDACSGSKYPALAAQAPLLLERVHRPFLHKALLPGDILRVSLEHQEFVHDLLPAIAKKLERGESAMVASFSAGAEQWKVVLEVLSQFRKEGDWTLCIRDANGLRLVSCSFSIASLRGKIPRPRVLIGCVQGPDRNTKGRELFRSLTRKWHGLRPKHLVVYLMQMIAREIAAHNVLIVSNAAHIYSSWRYSTSRTRVAADYETLAVECGASKSWRGWLLLGAAKESNVDPCNQEPMTRSSRRKILIEQLSMQVCRFVYSGRGNFE
ncbi:DUF535 family protein [Caballeronia sp. LZ035]|uniref:DUF535 family protein n=1 Tax=Caballeronia sp. LZ035 TaxID=3038568 RepID=UPI00285F3145|nr:DUF535 family protein [Caballeronia sp. LZ035]MDR5755611.1 DUF535 family protein [Caballeronia sp. LZ035]